MAFGDLPIAKQVITNAPKYTSIFEPFGNSGSVAFYRNKKKPKSHTVNYENVDLFNIMTFIKNVTTQQRKQLKTKDWVGHPNTFDLVLKISATDGLDFFYKFFYLKHFTMKTLDKEAPPTFDYLKFGKNVSSLLFDLPIQKNALKNVTLINMVAVDIMANGTGDFVIIVPSGAEQTIKVDEKINNVGGNVYYAKKSKSNQDLFDTADNNQNIKVSIFNSSSIMVSTMQEVTNYPNRLKPIVTPNDLV